MSDIPPTAEKPSQQPGRPTIEARPSPQPSPTRLSSSQAGVPGEGAQAPPRARGFPWFAYALVALLGLAVAGAGLALMFWYSPPPDLGTVTEVRITLKPGIDLSKVEDVIDTPDYYLEVWTPQGNLRTEVFKDIRVGNGLTFKLPVPLRLADVTEVKVWDQDVRKDSLVDRVDRPARDTAGEKFNFHLAGQVPPPTPTKRIALALACVGSVIFLLALLRFLTAQAI
jgi:hypothetical protein